MNHCWHEKSGYGHLGVQCCNCGIRWYEGLTAALEGHGPYAPKTREVPKPNKQCEGKPVAGKQGRVAKITDWEGTDEPANA